jgi:hypothetical protein
MKKSILLFCLIFPSLIFSQLKKKVLFLGNSYTYVNNLPQLIKDIALSKGDTLVFDQNVIGGYTFQNHSTDAQSLQKIKSNSWDIVVIQGQSQEPSFSPTQVMNSSYPYAKKLADSVRTANPCAEVMYYMTWGRKNGDASNCAAYPPVCTYNGMQARLRQSYLMFADSFNASCAPVGVAWKTFRNAYPSLELYDLDESHPAMAGSYLAACVFYSSIFKKNAIGATYYSTLNQADAQNMQTIGGNTVMDSTQVWNLNSQIPTADFNYSFVGGNTYQFTNTSVNATLYNWSFGSTQNSPQFTFAGGPPFSVTLTAINSCTSSTEVQLITPTTIAENQNCKSKTWYDPLNNELRTEWCTSSKEAEISIYDVNGRKVIQNKNATNTLGTEHLQNGIYIAELKQGTTTQFYKFLKQ